MSLQGLRQQSVRDVTGTAYDYNGDWHALFDMDGIATGPFNGRMLAWIRQRLGVAYTDLNDAMAAFAVSQGVTDWNSLGTFTSFPFTGASYHLSFSRNQYFWDGVAKTTSDFSSFVLGAGTRTSAGLTPASDTVITIPTSELGTVVPGAVVIICTQTSTPGTGRRSVELHDGTANERIIIGANTNNAMSVTITDGGVAQVSHAIAGAFANNVQVVHVASWETNDFKAAANGVAGAGDTSCTMPTVTTLQIGKGLAANTEFTGRIVDVIGFDHVLTQAECNNLSSVLRGF